MLTLIHSQEPRRSEVILSSKPPLAERDFLVYKSLSFDGKGPDAYRRVSFLQAASGLVAFGATGSGKTAGFMIPALKALAQNDCPGLVLDVKGDYIVHLQRICPDRMVVIGPSQGARPVNLIAGISLEVFSTLMEGMRLSNSKGMESYWGSAAVEDASLVFVAIQHYESRAPSLCDIAEALSSPIAFAQKLKNWMEADGDVPDAVRRMHQRRLADKFSLVNFTEASGSANETVREQYVWHVNHLLPSLLPFADNASIRETLCAGEVPNWADLIYAQNRIIAFDMPSAIFGSVAFTASKIVRLLVMTAVLSDTRKFEPGSGFGTEKFSFILADEYQEYISASGQRGLINDNTFFDRSRSFHHINVVATQGVSSLIAQVGEPATNAILQNLRTKLFLPTDDQQTLERAEMVATKSHVTMPGFLCNPTKSWSGFLYAPLADNTFLGSGPVLTGEAGGVCPHMIIDKSLEGSVRVFERHEAGAPNLCALAGEVDQTVGYQLHVLTTERSCSLADFAQALGDARDMHGELLDDWADTIAKPAVTLVSASARVAEWTRAMEKIENDAIASGTKVLLAIVRGGGASDAPELLAFNDIGVVTWVRRARTRGAVLPMFGVAHAQDDFLVHREAFLTGATPQGLGYRLGYVLSQTPRTGPFVVRSNASNGARAAAYETMATALNALYFPPKTSVNAAEETVLVETIRQAPAPSLAKPIQKSLFLSQEDSITPSSLRSEANKEWHRIGMGLLKIESQLGTSPAKAEKAVSEFMRGATLHYPLAPQLPYKSPQEVESLINSVLSHLPTRRSRKTMLIDNDSMMAPLALTGKPDTEIELEMEAFDADAFLRDLDLQHSFENEQVDPLLSQDRSDLELFDSIETQPHTVGFIAGQIEDAKSHLHVVRAVMKTFGDALWDGDTKAMLANTLALVDNITPLAFPTVAVLTEEALDAAIARLVEVEELLKWFGDVMSEEEARAVLKTVMAICSNLDPTARQSGERLDMVKTAMAVARMEIASLKARLEQAKTIDSPSEKSVLAPVLSNVAMFCANLLHQRQMSAVLRDARYRALANWSFLSEPQASIMKARFPTLKDICVARTRDVLEVENVDAETLKSVISWLDRQSLLHCLIDEDGLAKLDLFLVDDSLNKDESAWELPRLITGSYNVAKLFLQKVDERQRNILISENGGDSLATNFHSVASSAD